MYVPIWVVATLLYIITLVWLARDDFSRGGYFAGLAFMLFGALATIIYLLFWVIYLALT